MIPDEIDGLLTELVDAAIEWRAALVENAGTVRPLLTYRRAVSNHRLAQAVDAYAAAVAESEPAAP